MITNSIHITQIAEISGATLLTQISSKCQAPADCNGLFKAEVDLHPDVINVCVLQIIHTVIHLHKSIYLTAS